jgi:hypothetical protein
VVVPRLDHLACRPELVDEGRFWNVGERYVTIDMDEGPLGHEWLEIVGARVLLLVAGDILVVPKLINFPSRSCQHQ